MNDHASMQPGTRSPRFHIVRRDGWYRSIPFLFVTRRMCEEILRERDEILGRLPPSMQKQQRALFAKYDPIVSANAFASILELFSGSVRDAAR